jgi:signal transduction histidine kinase/ActR/RegA family two-component response regulator
MSRSLAWSIVCIWVALVCTSLGWNWWQVDNSITAMAGDAARSHFEKDLVFRRWVALHGGVYVPPTPQSPPNPYLQNMSERDVVTTGGKALTLVNPAYMTRQVHELAAKEYGVRGHITSLKPLRPENGPDEWERAALQAFETGTKEVVAREVIDNLPFLRLMRPLPVEADCIKCHEAQGYKLGDIRGGISIAVPFDPYLEIAARQRWYLMTGHAVIGLLGLFGLWWAGRRLRQTEQSLIASQAFAHATLDAFDAQICVLDPAGTIVAVNQVWRDFNMQNTPAPADGQSDVGTSYLAICDAAAAAGSDDASAMAAGIRRVISGEFPVFRLEYPCHSPTEKRWFCATVTRFRGVSDHVVVAHENITARRQADAELAQHRDHLESLVEARTAELVIAKEAAEAASRAKSAFLANMSHELRTPLNGIMGLTGIVLRNTTDPKQKDQLGKVGQASQNLLSIINDILDIAKIEAERLTLEHIDFKLGEVLENLNSLLRPRAAEKGVELRIDVSSAIIGLMLQGDPLRLGQVLLNLTGNAVKFTEAGSVTVRILPLEESATEVVLRFEVQDTGIGIPVEAQQRLFSTFEQADNSMTRKYGGTGLGLVISRRLANLMGGSIGVESVVGSGSTFWFTARLTRIGSMPSARIAQHDVSVEDQLKTRYAGRRLLLAEDEPINQEVSRSLLEEVGFKVDLAQNGEEAVDMAQLTDYALILMDVQMPVMNGTEATALIRAIPGREHTPILAMTANAFEEDRRQCLEAGMNDHIGKPVAPDHLYAVLLRWLHHSDDV